MRNEPYADLMDMQPPASVRHRPMPREARAAQFAPFAALTGYEAAVTETARLTDSRPEPDESQRAAIDARLQHLSRCLPEHPTITATAFVPDPRKPGGAIVPFSGEVKKLDPVAGFLTFCDGRSLPFEDILALDGAVFSADEL